MAASGAGGCNVTFSKIPTFRKETKKRKLKQPKVAASVSVVRVTCLTRHRDSRWAPVTPVVFEMRQKSSRETHEFKWLTNSSHPQPVPHLNFATECDFRTPNRRRRRRNEIATLQLAVGRGLLPLSNTSKERVCARFYQQIFKIIFNRRKRGRRWQRSNRKTSILTGASPHVRHRVATTGVLIPIYIFAITNLIIDAAAAEIRSEN